MHGVVGFELYNWVRSRYGDTSLLQTLLVSGSKPIAFVALMPYPDEDFFAFFQGAARVTGHSQAYLLRDFGHYVAPILVQSYSDLIPAHWTALDLIEHTEETIHAAVRREQNGAIPPPIRCERADGKIKVFYNSPRRLCEFAKGLMTGIGRFYKEELSITERSCMHRGSQRCEMVVRSHAAEPTATP